MRTTVNLAEDVLLAARRLAQRERISLGAAISLLVRRGAAADDGGDEGARKPRKPAPLRGRFALLPARDEVITPRHVRELIEREGT